MPTVESPACSVHLNMPHYRTVAYYVIYSTGMPTVESPPVQFTSICPTIELLRIMSSTVPACRLWNPPPVQFLNMPTIELLRIMSSTVPACRLWNPPPVQFTSFTGMPTVESPVCSVHLNMPHYRTVAYYVIYSTGMPTVESPACSVHLNMPHYRTVAYYVIYSTGMPTVESPACSVHLNIQSPRFVTSLKR
ncbi:hypothetical protein J6590_062884 [Homalodisca vitripennis]|nr:hypothetical protein J6590_062884 [Homalodisca vitripennis]